MAFIGYKRVSVSNTVLTVHHIGPIPKGATHAELQADTQNVRYTMDGSNPTTSLGMVLLTTSDPKPFLIDDIRNIRFIRSGGSDGALNVHYFGGRRDL